MVVGVYAGMSRECGCVQVRAVVVECFSVACQSIQKEGICFFCFWCNSILLRRLHDCVSYPLIEQHAD